MFISLEGIEGSGKSTLAQNLACALKRNGIACMVTREPGGCPLGNALRSILLNSMQNLDSQAELFLFMADRAQHVAEVVRPALQRGEWVICDRYTDSTLAYQGYGRGMDIAMLDRMCSIASGKLSPDITLLLDLPVEEGLRRARGRNVAEGLEGIEGRFEAEELAFHTRVHDGFLECAKLNPARFAVLDGRMTPQKLLEAAMARIPLFS